MPRLSAALAVTALIGVASCALAGDELPLTVADSHLASLDADTVDWDVKDTAYWKSVLTDKQVKVCRDGGTEYAWTGAHNKNKEAGTFVCSSCGLALFTSETKFDSGTGWPSFYAPAAEGAVKELADHSLGMVRTEVKCGRCDAHLGHVFADGPKPTGQRYCINSVCLLHEPAEAAPTK